MIFFRITRILLLFLVNLIAIILLVPLAIGLRVYGQIFIKKRKKIFIGLQEVSNNILSIGDCLSDNEFFCDLLVIKNDFYTSFTTSKPNLRIRYVENKGIFSSLIAELLLIPRFIGHLFQNDYFLIIWNRTFMFLSIDLLIMKLAGKNLILMHCGDDVRYRPLQQMVDKTFGLHTWTDEVFNFRVFRKNFYYQWLSEKCGQLISTRDQATFQRGKIFHFQFPQKKLREAPKLANHQCYIVHCPSNRSVKRTDIVLAAVERLRNKGFDFRFELIENQDNSYVLAELMRADILIDQPGVWIARLAVEAMASGCCVVGGNNSDYMKRYDSPVIQFKKSVDDLVLVLERLITDKIYLQNKMEACYKYWNYNYSYHSFARYFENVCCNNATSFFPINNQKQVILQKEIPFIQRIIIELFYHPKCS